MNGYQFKMSYEIVKALLTLTTSMFFLCSCMTIDPYRIDASSKCEYVNSNDCSDSAITTAKTSSNNTYDLNFFEFDDQGYLHNSEKLGQRKTKDKIIDDIKNEANKQNVFLLIFVHGWHHNTDGNPEDGNIRSFREVLSTAADTFGESKKVIGVYIGWRGDSVRVPLLDEKNLINTFTFWERKKTAHEIGGQGMTSLLLELEAAVAPNDKYNHHLMTVGHSFGAAALYSGISHILQERLISSRALGAHEEADGFGDLVVLLNPAFEGIKHSSLFELAQSKCNSYPTTQKPRLVIVSSSADLAVRWAFPTGRRVNAFFETHGKTSATHCTSNGRIDIPLKTSQTDRYAVGHNCKYITHDLHLYNNGKYEQSSLDCEGNRVDRTKVAPVIFGRTVLTSREITTLNNPILNIWTNGDVIGGHNDIWNDNVKELLYRMIAVANL
ncbi:lipase [Pseudoalteromonas arctica]|uniref:Lipase n=1 Tax=Pseudoalteromonas arctica TaxID=394751 RepID=A0A7Y0DTS9_9GAMM|nr:lipase [Pseudoalteromonas arctica]NMM41522.1 lipase [Pseudoalteromonas arctica]